MPRESFENKQLRAQTIAAKLRAAYPDACCELTHSNPLELLIATMLSAQCSDRQVNIATGPLFKAYRTAQDYANAPLEAIEARIRRLGLFHNKAKNIQAACRLLVEQHGGTVPASMEALTQLNGVGRKTANVVLGNAFGINDGFVVDTHVARLSQRLGLSGESNPEKIEKDLMRLAPRSDWMLLSHLLIFHGRRRCSARRPDCAHCEVSELCPSRSAAEM
jgi:endonuclease-3